MTVPDLGFKATLGQCASRGAPLFEGRHFIVQANVVNGRVGE